MATNPTFQLFPSSNDKSSQGSGLGLGFLDSPEPALPPPPPPIEVFSSEASSIAVDKVTIGEITLLKGRVSTKEVFGLPNSDLVPGVYEGGLKLWEGSIDLVKALEKESLTGNLSFSGKRVLELGCGHALPGIYACLKGADAIHFQDFNAEVLRCLTIPNLYANLSEKTSSVSVSETQVRFFAGEWSEVHQILPLVNDGETDKKSGYDIILMAETIYSISAQKSLYELIKRCLVYPDGAVYMAAKKYYFGVGGGTRQFLSMIEKDGVLASTLVSEVTDGSSNVREVWKLSYK
ncbi:hypothetical protein V5N11_029249 [Cardamine amara subsp. amara]|uniref:protein-histidine N-methyltransferase n=1 Tax=Cardamine amara subsp. amara TaxID=228776 RepID=A0ABD1BQW6_CARAN